MNIVRKINHNDIIFRFSFYYYSQFTTVNFIIMRSQSSLCKNSYTQKYTDGGQIHKAFSAAKSQRISGLDCDDQFVVN